MMSWTASIKIRSSVSGGQ